MKGNQGLEALAALCGGQPKASGSASAIQAVSATPVNAASAPVATSSQADSNDSGSDINVNATTTNLTSVEQNSESSRSSRTPGSTGAKSTQHQHVHSGSNTPPVATALNAIAMGKLTPQQISQAIISAANGHNGRFDPALPQSFVIHGGLNGGSTGADSVVSASVPPVSGTTNNNVLASTMQQLLIQQYLQAQATAQQQHAQQQHQAAAAVAAASSNQQAALLAMALAAGKTNQNQHILPNNTPSPTTPHSSSSSGSHQKIVPTSQHSAQTLLQQHMNQIQNPQSLQQQYHYNTTDTSTNQASMTKALPAGGRILPSMEVSPALKAVVTSGGDKVLSRTIKSNVGDELDPGSKKQQKRAANRRSAQLSRKRKKQFIEELKEENDDLRRKEQILRAIPDLVVVFDSSGKLGFVSESVGRFLNVPPKSLEGKSFWELVCQESVRLLKAAFMDSLAAREAESDTAELGSGVWELRLKNNESRYIPVTLNGVVHFKGDAPECVCCIRPLGEQEGNHKQQEQKSQPSSTQEVRPTVLASKNNPKMLNRPVSCSDGDASRSSEGSNRTLQSVFNDRHGHSNLLSSSSSTAAVGDPGLSSEQGKIKLRRVMGNAQNGDESNSGSDDGSNDDKNVDGDGTNNSIRISDGSSNDGVESD